MLGPLEVTAGGQSLGLAGARTRAVLAMLLVHANQVVSAERLIEELWPGQPADRAADSLQVRLSELRKALRAAGEADRLATRPPGYLLRVTPGEADAGGSSGSPPRGTWPWRRATPPPQRRRWIRP